MGNVPPMQHKETFGTVQNANSVERQCDGATNCLRSSLSHRAHSAAAPSPPTGRPLRLLTPLTVNMLRKNPIIYPCMSQLPHKSIIYHLPLIMHSCQRLDCGESISLEAAAGPVTLFGFSVPADVQRCEITAQSAAGGQFSTLHPACWGFSSRGLVPDTRRQFPGCTLRSAAAAGDSGATQVLKSSNQKAAF